jgi:hypothetical protein
MWRKGEVTVFVSLMLAVLLAFLQICLQSARYAFLRSQTEEALELAEYSALSEYHRELLERYGLFYLDLGYGSSQENTAYLEQRIRSFLNMNLSAGQTQAVAARDFSRATDEKGMAYYEQAVSVMKEKTGVKLLEQLTDYESKGREAVGKQGEYEVSEAQERENLEELERRREEEEQEGTPDPTSGTEALKRSSVLNLVLSDPQAVSGKKVDLSGAPSVRTCLAGSGARGIYPAGVANDAFFLSYLMEYFSNAVDYLADDKEAGSWLDYQLEYVIAGKDSDMENLESVCERLLLIREGMNYAYLLTDSAKKAECEALAAALVGATMIPGLVEALKQVLLLSWAFAESVQDVNRLLSGKRVVFQKSRDTWRLSLEAALNLGEHLTESGEEEDSGGLSYREYLGILLAVTARETKTMRSLDAIEGVIRELPGCRGFYVDQCTDGFTVRAVILNGRELTAERWFCYEW